MLVSRRFRADFAFAPISRRFRALSWLWLPASRRCDAGLRVTCLARPGLARPGPRAHFRRLPPRPEGPIAPSERPVSKVRPESPSRKSAPKVRKVDSDARGRPLFRGGLASLTPSRTPACVHTPAEAREGGVRRAPGRASTSQSVGQWPGLSRLPAAQRWVARSLGPVDWHLEPLRAWSGHSEWPGQG